MKKIKMPLKLTVALAMLGAISIVLGKYLAISVGDFMRFSLENLPIIFAGCAFGPVAGGLVGAVADLVGCVLVGYAINPIVTLGAASVGIIAGGVWSFLKKMSIPTFAKCALCTALSHLVGSVIIKTVGLSAYGMHIGILMMWRLLNYLVVGAVEFGMLNALMKSRMITEQINSIMKRRSGSK